MWINFYLFFFYIYFLFVYLFVIYLTMLFGDWLYKIEWKGGTHEWWIGKDLEGIGRGLILRHYSGIYLQGLKKITNTLSQDSLFPGRDFKPGTPT
jgi:hypothetical protein